MTTEQSVEEYDRQIAEGVREQLQNISKQYDISMGQINRLFLTVEKVGCIGMSLDDLTKKVKDAGLKKKVGELVALLDRENAGLMITKKANGAYGNVMVERRGRYYMDRYLTQGGKSETRTRAC